MKKRNQTPRAHYPWDAWFAKKKFVLHRTQYSCMPHCIMVMIRNQASRRGRRVSITLSTEDTITVTDRGPRAITRQMKKGGRS